MTPQQALLRAVWFASQLTHRGQDLRAVCRQIAPGNPDAMLDTVTEALVSESTVSNGILEGIVELDGVPIRWTASAGCLEWNAIEEAGQPA